jgi:hypothetical protein
MQKLGLNRWSHNRIGKYSLEEIALEFILWEDEAAHTDTLRRNFIYEALEESVGDEDRDEMLARFFQAYERLYEKIYQRKRGNLVKEHRATPETVRQLLYPGSKRKAA